MPTAFINGFDLYYDEGGAGPPVVFVHGGFACLKQVLHSLPRDGSDWEWEWENDFAGHFRFVAYDRRGCWRSSRTDGDYELHNQALDLECLLDLLGIQSVHLIGSSARGPVAVVFAATKPEWTRSLILAGTGMNLFDLDDHVTEVVLKQIEMFKRDGAASAFQGTAWGRGLA